jgi:putative FmdB family regulatory protein
MPIYEYRCKQCKFVNEFLSKMGDKGETLSCKNCGSNNLEKMLSVASISTSSFSNSDKECCEKNEGCTGMPCGTGCCNSQNSY